MLVKDWKYLYKEIFDRILFPAAINNHFEYFKMFVEWGAQINIQDFQGWTPLHCAAYSGNIEIVRFLCDNPVTEIEVEDDERRTPLLVSIQSGNIFGMENTTSVLLKAGKYKYSSLMWQLKCSYKLDRVKYSCQVLCLINIRILNFYFSFNYFYRK